MSDTHRITASGCGTQSSGQANWSSGSSKMASNSAVIMMVLPLPVAADKAITCWLSGETALRALTKASRNLPSASF